MNARSPIRLVALAPVALSALLLAGCGGSSGGGATTAGDPAPGGATSPATGGSQSSSAATSSSDAKCTDLTAAAASAAVGKTVTVTFDTTGTQLPGLTICDIADAADVFPIQLDVDTTDTTALFAADEQADGGVDLSGVGDKAFTSSIGVEALSGGVDIQVIGPAGPVLSNDYTIPTAVAKAMIAALN
jgi:hypothetical protein